MVKDEYAPVLVHYIEADRIEYVTRDVPSIYERIDENIDIVRDMETKEIIGVQINNWSHHECQVGK